MRLLVKKDLEKLYLPNILGDFQGSLWSSAERKMAFLVFCMLDKNRKKAGISERVFRKDIKNFNELDMFFKNIDTEVIFKKKYLEEKLSIPKANFSRDFKNLTQKLQSRTSRLANPLEPNKPKSFVSLNFFPTIKYLDEAGEIKIKINNEAVKYILYLVDYSVIDIDNFLSLKNDYATNFYIFFKTLQNKYHTHCEISFSLKDIREKLSIENKYKQMVQLKEKVLDVIKKEINEKTELELDYFLTKTGRKFTDITFIFCNKSGYENPIEKLDIQELELQQKKIKVKPKVEKTYPSQEYLIVEINLNIKKIKELYIKYNEDDVVDFIEMFKNYYVKKGGTIKNKSGYFLTSLENYIKQLNMKKIMQKSKQATDERDLFENYCRYLKRADVVEYIDYILSYSFLNATIINEEVIVFLNENLSKLQKFAYYGNSEKRFFDFKLSKLNLIDLLDLVKTAKVKLCSTTDEWNSTINCNIQNAKKDGLEFYYKNIEEFLKFPNKTNSFLVRDKKFVEDLDNMEKTILDKLKSQNQ